MILLVAATAQEMAPLRERAPQPGAAEYLISGVGLLETAVSLTSRLSQGKDAVTRVINFGVAGAFPGKGIGLLDICLAEREVLGDFGVCFADGIEEFAGPGMSVRNEFILDTAMLRDAAATLGEAAISFRQGTFVTVQGVSGTAGRGRMLRDRFDALCENMEGAAVARVCEAFGIPCLELRSISNLVEERNLANWKLTEASERAAEAVALLVWGLRT